jgi:hypothetical protein
VTPREALLLLRSALLAILTEGHVPLLPARVTPQSTASLAIAIMSESMFDVATSHDGEGLFVWLVTPHLVELGSPDRTITHAVERQARGGFIFTLSGLPLLLMMPCPRTFACRNHATYL